MKTEDIEALSPFHWGYEFDQIINERGGFDAIITNPPWEVFQTDEKEFFQEYIPTIKKKKLQIEDWKKQQAKLMKDAELRIAWLSYASRFPHLAKYFKTAHQYKNQASIVNGKNVGSKINLYTYFLEECFNLLREGGECGIVIPSGIYTDLGTKQLRELLFSKTEITGLFGCENRKEIFEGVHRSYKFVILTFKKGPPTTAVPAAFMRLDVEELDAFPRVGSLMIPVDLIRRLSPDSLSMMEFKEDIDLQIAEKMFRFPVLSADVSDAWSLVLGADFNMTTDSYLFVKEPRQDRVALYEGKMIHQFDHRFNTPRYWVDEKKGRKAVVGRSGVEHGRELAYEKHRLAFRDVARNTDKRTLIAAIIPRRVFAGNTIILSQEFRQYDELLFVQAAFNSFACDYVIRQKVTAHCNMFYVYQLPVPRLTAHDPAFAPIVNRAAKLTCFTSEFDDLAREVGLGSHKNGVTNLAERAKLRAELDGMIAHLYGLTEEEFTHILSTFPLVEQSVKAATLEAYRELAPKPGDQEIAALITKGESNQLEFKSSARWDYKQAKQNKVMEDIVVKTVAAFLNTDGGNLLIGVDDGRNILGLDHDYKLFGKKDSRDAYENFLTTLLLGNFGKDSSPLISITIHQLGGKDVAKVAAQPSPKPVFVKDANGEHLYIRAGNSTRLLSTREAIDYCKIRWQT